MDVIEVLKEKKIMEENIINIISVFEKKTQTSVERIDVNRTLHGGVTTPIFIDYDVKAKVCL